MSWMEPEDDREAAAALREIREQHLDKRPVYADGSKPSGEAEARWDAALKYAIKALGGCPGFEPEILGSRGRRFCMNCRQEHK